MKSILKERIKVQVSFPGSSKEEWAEAWERMNRNPLEGVSPVQLAPEPVVKNPECDLRNYLDFDCEETLSSEEESSASIQFCNKIRFVDEDFEDSLESVQGNIEEAIGTIDAIELEKLKEENKKLDELLDKQSQEMNAKKLGINFIPGNSNNI